MFLHLLYQLAQEKILWICDKRSDDYKIKHLKLLMSSLKSSWAPQNPSEGTKVPADVRLAFTGLSG
jgi:hypothetical protein